MAIPRSIINQPNEWANFFRGKTEVPTQAWRDLNQEEYGFSFAIAGVTNLQFLKEVRELLQEELAKPEGSSFRQFLKNFDKAIARRGWAGDKPWRRKLIWHQNTRSAYAQGRYQQQVRPESLRLQGAWRWAHRWPKNPRPDHIALDGKLYPPGTTDFSGQSYPPNGYFFCHCAIVTESAGSVRRKGFSPMSPVQNPPKHLPGQDPESRDRIANQIAEKLPPDLRQSFTQWREKRQQFLDRIMQNIDEEG
jgi:hypothetical protein